jgi:hypothetical protein
METTATFSFITTGKDTGNPYSGEFQVKTLLSRRDAFMADQLRREIVGPSPEGTPPVPALQGEAYMLGQLQVRIISAPAWWKDSNFGRDLLDSNIVSELFELAMAKAIQVKANLQEEAKKGYEDLKKKTD